MLTIKLIKFMRNGKLVLVGATLQDRWNLFALGYSYLSDYNTLRRLKNSEGEAFQFEIVRGTIQQLQWNGALALMGNDLGAWASFLRDWLNSWKGSDLRSLRGEINRLVA